MIFLFAAIGIVAAGRVHAGSIRPQMELSFAPSNRKCSVSIAFYIRFASLRYCMYIVLLYFLYDKDYFVKFCFKGTCNTDLWRDY